MTFDPTTIAAMRAELADIQDQIEKLRWREAAINYLTGDSDGEEDDREADDQEDDLPPATFAAADAQRHQAAHTTRSTMAAKLSAEDIAEIRRLHAAGKMSHDQLGAKYRISRSTSSNIVRRRGLYATI